MSLIQIREENFKKFSQAKELIKSGGHSVEQACKEVGWKHVSTYYKLRKSADSLKRTPKKKSQITAIVPEVASFLPSNRVIALVGSPQSIEQIVRNLQ